MATKKEIRNVNIHINGKEVKNDIKSIGGEYKKAKNELAKLTIGSDAYNKKLKEVKKLKGILDEHRKSLGFVQSTWQKLGGMMKSFLPVFGLSTLLAGIKKLNDFTEALKQNRAEVKKLSDLTGPALNNATSRVTAIADVYKKDFGEVLQATNNLSKQMGITFNESFDLIEKGFQAGADANGEFLEQVREYPTFFKEAEYNAEQFISTITKQTKSGIFSDKGIDAIKEATLSLREMTEPTKEALKALGIDSVDLSLKISSGQIKMSDAISLVAKKMSELPAQSQAVGMGLADIFKGAGEDAGVEFISTLSDINTELEEMIDNNDDLVITQQNNLIATTEWNEAMLRMFGSDAPIKKGWSKLKSSITTGLNDIMTVLTNPNLTFIEKIAIFDNGLAKYSATVLQAVEVTKAEEEAYKLLNKQLVLMARNIGIEIDLTNLTNQEIQELIDKKKAQIEAERQLAKAEKDRQKEAEKAYKKYLATEEKLQNKIRELREQLHLDTLTDQAKEIQAVKNKYAKLIEEAEGHNDVIKELEELRAQEIAAINAKYEDDKLKKREEVEQKINEMLLQGKNKEIYAVAKKYQELIKLAEQFGFDTTELFAQMQEQIAEIEENYSDDGENSNLFMKIFGLDEEGWADLQGKFNMVFAFIDQAAAAYSAYSNLRQAQDDAEMQRFEKNTNNKKVKLEKQLNRGIISQEEYVQKAEQLDLELDRKKAQLMKEQSEREKTAAYFNAAINTAAAIIGFMADPGGWAGVALSAIAALTGGLQIAAISSEPVPAYEHGGRIKKEGIIYAGEGNKEEGVLSNKMLTDPTYGPMANYLLDVQDGKSAVFPSNATEMPDSGSISQAMDYNAFQRSGGQYSQPVVNNYYTTSSEQEKENLDNTEFAQDIKKLAEFMSDPKNRQAYINYDKQKESESEMNLLNSYNNF